MRKVKMSGLAPILALVALALPVGLRAATVRTVKRDIHGIGLGMTAEQILAAATFTCAVNKGNDVSCEDSRHNTDYKVMMSGGHPSVALTIKQTFCSAQAPSTVLAGLLQSYGVGRSAARANPNGASFDVSNDVQGNLNTAGDECKAGRTYQFTLRDNSLMRMQGTGAGIAGTQTEGLTKPPAQP